MLKEVSASCYEHKREAVRRAVCRVAAQTFMREREFGLAVSYCVSAEDWAGLGRVVDRMLQVYITQGTHACSGTLQLCGPCTDARGRVGPEEYARSVAKIAPSLQTLRAESKANGVFVYRLQFAVRFAEFHYRRLNGALQDAAFDLVAMLREEIAPKSWWAVLLSDAVELLQNSAYSLKLCAPIYDDSLT